MLKSPREVISLNPTAPPFNYTQHTARSKSSSSSSASSSSGTSTTTQTSIHSTKFSFPTPNFKEFIPQSGSILKFRPTKFPLAAASVAKLEPSSSDCSVSEFSGGLASSIPSDTTFATQDGPKPEDMLLAMKMKSIEFSQTYYLERAAELGISLHLENVIIPGQSRRDRSSDRKAFYNTEQSITSCPRSSNRKHSKSKYHHNSSSPNRRVGDVWDGYVVQSFTTRKVDKLRDWEWDCPVPEMISEVVWSEDEESKVTTESHGNRYGGGSSTCGSLGVVDSGGGIAVDGDGKKSDGTSGGDGIGGAKNIAPRGKSWMIVTQKMIDEYLP